MTYGRISWSNSRVLAALLLVFLCGAAAGALTIRLAARHWTARTPPVILPENKRDLTAKFQKELDLSQDQVEKLEIILDDYMKYMHDLQAQMDDVRVHGKDMILKILNEDQRKKFDKMVAAAQGRPLR